MANTKIPSELIADSSITAAKLADGTITTADIADSNVTTAKIADSNVTTAKIGDAQVTTAKITDANVTTGKIADDAVTTAKMASNSVTSDTIASGITLAGTTTLSSHLVMGDNDYIKLGDSSDLLITHDGSGSWIIDNGTGGLVLASDTLSIKNAAYNEQMISAVENGAVTLYYDNNIKFVTKADGVDITGELQADSLDIDGNADITGNLVVAGADHTFYSAAADIEFNIGRDATQKININVDDNNVKLIAQQDADGNSTHTYALDRYFAGTGANNFEIQKAGSMQFRIDTNGAATFTHDVNIAADDRALRIGAGADFALFHDAVDSTMRTSTGNLILSNTSQNNDILFKGNDSGTIITALTLDMSNSGQATFNSSVFVGNHLYLVDNKKAVFGDGEDLQIFSDGTHGFIRNHTDGGSVYNRAHTNWVVQTNASDGGADTAIQALRNGAIELYHDNDLTFQTTTSGVQIGRNNDTTVRLQLYGAGSADHEIFFGNDGTNGHKDGAIRYYGETNGVTANRRAMTFSTANSEKMRITSAGVLESKSHVITGIDNNAFEVKTNHSGNPSAVKVAGTGSINGISGSFQNFTVLNVMQDSGALNSIYAAGNIKTDGNINIGTSGKGISFSPTGDGSGSMSSELLDDYEEGSWTPACGATLSTAEGKYTKIGNQVTVYYHLVTTGGLPTSTSQVVITGLPYTSNSGSLVAAPIYARYYTPNDSSLTSLVYDNESQIRLMNINDQNFDLTIWGELEASHNNSVYMIGSATYMV